MTVPYHNDIIQTMTGRRWFIVGSIGVMIIVGSLVTWRWRQLQDAKRAAALEAATQQAKTAELLAVLDNPYEKIIFLSRSGADSAVFITTSDDGTTVKIMDDAALVYSNVLAEQQVWYSVADRIVQRHHTDGTTTAAGTLSRTVTMADALGTQASLAVDPTEQYLAWVNTDNEIESVRLYNLATHTDTEIFSGEAEAHYSNLTWSPDGSELAFTANAARLITVTTDGAEIYNRVSIPFAQLQYVSWLDRDHFGCVLTSTDTNADPFSPKVVVLDRFGGIIEEHPVLNKVGVPKVVWSADGNEFLFHDPWRNTFVVYDRYDQLLLNVTADAPGKFVPLGWTDGEQWVAAASADTATTNTPTTDTILGAGTNDGGFEISAEEWDQYNTAVRAILKQFKIDFDTYRFATTAVGFDITFSVLPEQSEPEMIVLQTLLQIFAVIPDVPAITVRATLPEDETPGEEIIVLLENVTRTAAEAMVDRFTTQLLDGLFVINKNYPVGKRAVKPDQPDYHYIGDVVYSNGGEYNPNPALAALDAHIGNRAFYFSDTISFLYPAWWTIKEIDEQTTLLYTGDTTFASPTAWSSFGVTVKRYAAPGVTLKQWLSVNRSDQTIAAVDVPVHEPLEIRHIVSEQEYSDEYIMYANGAVYVVQVERDAGLTAEDPLELQHLIESFTDHYAFQRD